MLPRERVVDVEILQRTTPIPIQIIFQDSPIWLFCLDPQRISHIYLPQFRDKLHLLNVLSSKNIKTNLCERVLNRFGNKNISFWSTRNPFTLITLVSGSLNYIVPFLRDQTTTTIVSTDTNYHGKIRQGRPNGVMSTGLGHVTWCRVRHLSVGGASKYISLLGVSGVCISPLVSSIRRSLRHFIDYSVKPTSLHPQNNQSSLHLSIDDLIHPDKLNQTVQYSTHFSATGFGYRQLNANELSSIYGLHSRLRMGGLEFHDFQHLVPIQILDSVLTPVVKLITQSSSREQQSSSIHQYPNFPTAKSDLSQTWLPSLSRYLPHSWVDLNLVTSKAAKRDDSEIPVTLWNSRITLLFPGSEKVLPLIRLRLLQRQRRRLLTEIRLHLSASFGSSWSSHLLRYREQLSQITQHCPSRGVTGVNFQLLNHEATLCQDILSKHANSSWWQWDAGSTLYFWRWGAHIDFARDGIPPYITSKLPTNLVRATRPKACKVNLMVPKFDLILNRGYVIPGQIKNLTDYFDVPKADDIRLVYNGTSCGLNNALWAPNFWLPTAKSAIRSLDFNYFSVDMDFGDMFLNFPLHSTLQPYSGIDLTPFKSELGITSKGPFFVHWTRCWMGARSSPYCAVAFFYLAEEFIRGNHLSNDNPMRWDSILLNLPGSKSYNPSKPRVMKWDSCLQCIAGDIISFVDDLRATGPTMEHAWQVARLAGSRLQYLGCQDAARKRRPPTKTPGAWAGAVFKTCSTSVVKLVTQEKWDKAKVLIKSLRDQLDMGKETTFFNYKELEQIRGFFVHLSMTYDTFTHHLKGFHLTLAAHCPRRNDEGWKLNDNEWLMYLESKVQSNIISSVELEQRLEKSSQYPTPTRVRPLPQLVDDIYALSEFLSMSSPPEIEDRRSELRLILYGFADASGGGLGSSVLIPGTGIRCRTGVWGKDEENNSSNFKEFENVVSTIEQEAKEGTLKGSLMFLFTDNSTVEGALYKGNTPSRKLFELIVRFRKVQLQNNATILVSHVSGKRMIAQGTDGISRGEMNEGIGQGQKMLSFIPLHLSALDRYPPLSDWIKTWAGHPVEILSTNQWFTRGHGHDGGSYDKSGFWRPHLRPGTFIWIPPPAAADVSLEELRKSSIKRHDSMHIFLCPKLLTCEWRRQLNKAADLVLFLPAGSDGWPLEMHEPLTIGFLFPFLDHSPWQLRGTPKMFQLARSMSKMLRDQEVASRDIQSKLLIWYRNLSAVLESMVQNIL